MRSPTLALLWLTWGRHRWGLAVLVLGLVGLCALHRALPTDAFVSETTMVVLSISITLAFVYIIYVFSYAELGARVRTSGFPPWLFTLAVPTSRLVLWPMLSGALTIAVTWMAVAYFLLQPAGLHVSIVWPALALAVSLAWIQAMDWSPLGGVTKALAAAAVLIGTWLPLSDESLPDGAVIAVPCLLPLAFVVAVAGVGYARRGGQADGLGSWLLARVAAWLPRRQRPFPAPGHALLWWETRRNGIVLPIVAGCLLLLLLLHRWDMATLLGMILGDLFFLLPVLAVLVGCVLGKADIWARPLRLSSFFGIRPVRTGDLVIAKLKMGALSVLATWLLIAACSMLWLGMTGNFSEVKTIWEQWLMHLTQRDLRPAMEAGTLDPDAYMEAIQNPTATLRACLLPGLYVTALFGFTWLLLVGNLFASLAGRLWVLGAVFFFYLAGLPNLMVFQSSLRSTDPKLYDAVVDALPWLATLAVAVKFSVAAWALYRACQRGLLTTAAARGIVVIWCLVVAAVIPTVYSVVVEERAPLRYVALGCILACPLVRIAGAPLVLEWNRRR
jgi:hypothetical protein